MPTIVEVVEDMMQQGVPEEVARNSAAQFGTPNRTYLGAQLLPERNVMENMYREEAIRFRTVVASDSPRYGGIQQRGADLYATFQVELGNSNIGANMTAQQYETLMRYLNTDQTQSAIIAATRWLDIRINRALIENKERQRWECITDAQVMRVGDNNYEELVQYADPPGHRFTPSAPWSDPNTEIFEDIHTANQVLIDKGYMAGRLVTSRRITNLMARNNTVKARGGITVVEGSSISTAPGRATVGMLSALLSDDGLPEVETYDLQFQTQDGTKRFLRDDCMVLISTTEREDDLDLGDTNVDDLIPFDRQGTIIGYHAVGKAAGQAAPGRVINMFAHTNHPPRVEAEGVATHLPVLQFPEALVVIRGIV